MAHLFNPSNPTLLIQSGLVYFIGRAGCCTQLSPVFAGQGTGAGNPAANSPGQPNLGAGGNPYTPIFPPFPPASGPGLASFSITRAGGSQRLFYRSGGVGFASPCGASTAYGTLNSGGGTNGAVLLCIQAQSASSGPPGLFGVVLQLPSPASNSFPTNPFTISTWNTITFTTSGTDTPANHTYVVASSGLPFSATGTAIGGYNAVWGQSGYTGTTLPSSYTANETLTFTVT